MEGYFRSFPGFGIVMIVAHFQSAGKYTIRKQPFNMRVRKRMTLLGRCFSVVLDIVPILAGSLAGVEFNNRILYSTYLALLKKCCGKVISLPREHWK